MNGRQADASASSRALGYLSLFTSVGTLVCCALPSLLVLAGLGATVASFLSVTPWLVALSTHKVWVFAVSGALIGMNLVYLYRLAPRLRASGEACAPEGACRPADRVSRIVLWVSLVIYLAGLCAAFLLGPLLVRYA
ncbi:hypothetical protein BH24ACI5_BH24ACI5_27190 [soil metagenome]